MSLKQLVLNALVWLIGGKFSAQLINWAITLYVIRLLTPDDYGLMALASVFVTILFALGQLGLGSALVQREHVDLDLQRKTFGFVLVVAVSLCGALVVCAPLIASIFETAGLTPILRIMSLSLIILAFTVVPRAILAREIRFKEQSIVDMSSALIGGLVTLALALHGYGVWSLVLGNLATSIVLAGGLVCATRFYHFPSLDLRGTSDVLLFGSWATGAHMMWMFWAQVDVFIVGKTFGQQLLGFYAVGKHIAELPLNKIQGILNQVAFPAFKKADRSNDDPAYYLEKQLRLTALVAFPVFLGMSAVSPEMISLVLGEKWLGAVIPLQILCLGVPLKTLEAAFPPYLMALGHVKIHFMTMAAGVLVMSMALVLGTQWGLPGVSAGWSLSTGTIFLLMLAATASVTNLSARRVLKLTARTATPGLLMYAIVSFSRTGLEGEPLLMTLSACIGIGVVVYGVLALLMCRQEIIEIRNLFRREQEQTSLINAGK
jgi:O-antigen/teichoic acid export membrane protein